MLTRLTTLIGVALFASVGFAIAETTEKWGLGSTAEIAVLAFGGMALVLLSRTRSIG